VLPEKFLPALAITKGFGAAGTGGGERAREVSPAEAGIEIGAAHVLRKKAGIEAVSGADGIDEIDFDCRAAEALASALRHGALFPHLHDQQRNLLREPRQGGLEVIGLRDAQQFPPVGQEYVHVGKNFVQPALPAVAGVIIRV